MSECEVRYVVDSVRLLLESGSSSMEVREETFDAYQRRVDEAGRLRAWGFSKVSSWYKNSTGRSTQVYPLKVLEFWQRTRQVDADDFLVSPRRAPGAVDGW
jgi:4-hydroxyacetophenone monooxygenase